MYSSTQQLQPKPVSQAEEGGEHLPWPPMAALTTYIPATTPQCILHNIQECKTTLNTKSEIDCSLQLGDGDCVSNFKVVSSIDAICCSQGLHSYLYHNSQSGHT